MKTLFHLAFPVHDFEQTKWFYQEILEFEQGRESEHALIFNFASHQIVAHKVDEILPEQQGIYPRHFGLVFLQREEFDHFMDKLLQKKLPFEIPLKTRFTGTKIEHFSFFLKDPSNNLLEFKYYTHPSAIFGERDSHRVGESS
ncbi:Glyoxalase/Bleomycin resistance family protein [Legionella birminghamensis]|uniref:Glyoxalase/Bleomycin resistance family protein n=1 Tax=Legionella birminghamensis TaxID=28083 RepID=A0A378I9Y5_9GAMM|nr:VOC family protein [Legionella birminghamensis]KTC75196.1 Glyoxalase/Bleomycin resistance family protein [Legionella birminghamensis]STX31853.1 Glyoxalase/Bleomycin resistance family protein [Legionella birminghamensis]